MIYFLIPSIDGVLFLKLSFFDADSFDVAGAHVKTKVELAEVEGVTQGQGHQTSFGTCFFVYRKFPLPTSQSAPINEIMKWIEKYQRKFQSKNYCFFFSSILNYIF